MKTKKVKKLKLKKEVKEFIAIMLVFALFIILVIVGEKYNNRAIRNCVEGGNTQTFCERNL